MGAVGTVEDGRRAGAREAGRGAAVGAHGRNLLRTRQLGIGACAAQVEDVDRAGALADLAEPGADRERGDLPRRRGGLQRLGAAGQEGGQGRGVGAAGAVRGAVGVALAGDLDRLLAVEEEVDQAARCGRR